MSSLEFTEEMYVSLKEFSYIFHRLGMSRALGKIESVIEELDDDYRRCADCEEYLDRCQCDYNNPREDFYCDEASF